MHWPLIVVLLVSCTPDEDRAKKVLEAHGFENIYLGGYPFFGCGKDDVFNVAFTATTAKRQAVQGSVCCGIWKNCTVRVE